MGILSYARRSVGLPHDARGFFEESVIELAFSHSTEDIVKSEG